MKVYAPKNNKGRTVALDDVRGNKFKFTKRQAKGLRSAARFHHRMECRLATFNPIS